MAEAASADDDGVFAREQMARRLLGRAICGQAGVRVRRYVFRRQRLRQLDQRALAGQQIFRIAAIRVDARKAAALSVHVVATPAGQTMAARDKRVANDCVADLHPLDAFADFLDPSCVFVAHDVGKIDVDLAAPDTLDDVQVSAAHAGSADPDDHLRRTVNSRVRDVLVFDELSGGQLLVVGMENGSLHVSSRYFYADRAADSVGRGNANGVPTLET